MLTRIFGQINSATQLILGMYAVLLAAVHVYFIPIIESPIETAFGRLKLEPIFIYVLLGLLYLVIAYGYQWLCFDKFRLVKHHAYVPFVLLPLVFMNYRESLLVPFIHLVLLILIIYTWLDAYQGKKMLSQSLNTGLLIGIGSLIDVHYAFLLIDTYIVYFMYGRISVRTVIIPAIGYLSVWFISLALDFLLLDSSYVLTQFSNQFSGTLHFSFPSVNWPAFVVLAALMLFGLSELTKTATRANVFKRQSYSFFFISLVLSVASFLFRENSQLDLALMVFTIALMFANYLQYLKRSWLKELLLWIVLLLFGIFEAGVI
jgi:hypothetical protein